MERLPVTSSTIASIGYDKDSQILEVEFSKGGIYQYYNVPESTYRSLMSAESAGSYLHTHVKGIYSYDRVGD